MSTVAENIKFMLYVYLLKTHDHGSGFAGSSSDDIIAIQRNDDNGLGIKSRRNDSLVCLSAIYSLSCRRKSKSFKLKLHVEVKMA